MRLVSNLPKSCATSYWNYAADFPHQKIFITLEKNENHYKQQIETKFYDNHIEEGTKCR